MNKDVEIFASFMDSVLNRNQKEKGDSWKTISIDDLDMKLQEEISEYNQSKDKSELVDIANVCMMLFLRKAEMIWGK